MIKSLKYTTPGFMSMDNLSICLYRMAFIERLLNSKEPVKIKAVANGVTGEIMVAPLCKKQ